mgnify:FL=1|tara:strand:- start:8917 stop:9555 length:639 start_codon:yes stop_codon:yes gene_type:complete
MSNSSTNLSITLKKLLSNINLSEAELARRTGIAQPMINRLATGKNANPKLQTLKPIAKYFGVTFSQLLGEEILPAKNELEQRSVKWYEASLINAGDIIKIINKESVVAIKTVTTNIHLSDSAFAFLINNDHYEPKLTNNTMLFVDPEANARNRDLTLVLDTETQKVSIQQLIVDNNDKYLKELSKDPELHTLTDESSLKVLGVVVQTRYDYR